MSSVHRVNATDYDDALLKLVDLATNDNCIAAAIAGGGTGYTTGDILTVVGGTIVSALVATLEVTADAAGVISGIRVMDCGAYSAQPGNPVSVTGGTGTGATFNLTFETQNWAVNRNDASSNSLVNYPGVNGGGGTQVLGREVQFQGPGNAGADEIYCGILEVENPGNGSFNWAIAGFTGYDGGLRWEDQPGFSFISPQEVAAFTPLTNGAIECWFYISPRVLTGILRIGSTYNNFTMGFLNPFATPDEYPYPLYISGCSTKWNENFSTSGVRQSGITDPGAYTSTGGNIRGPGGIRFTDGVWWPVSNWSFNGTTRTATGLRAVYPCQQALPGATYVAPADKFVSNVPTTQWAAIIPDTGNPGNQTDNLFPVQDSGGDQTVLVPTMVYFTDPALQIAGEISDVLWGSTSGNNIVSQDRVIIGGIYYRAFQNCNRSDVFAFVFMREDV